MSIRNCEFLRRIPDDVWDLLMKAVKEPNPPRHVSDFRSYLEGTVEESTLVESLLLHSCRQEGDVETFQLFDAVNKVNPLALRIFREELGPFFQQRYIKKLPPEKTRFFRVIHFPKNPETAELFQSILFSQTNPGIREKNGRYVQLVLPPPLLNAVLITQFGGTARLAKPVLGFFKKKERLTDPVYRPASLAFNPFLYMPKTLHELSSTDLQCYHHDTMYHLWIDSANIHREDWRTLFQLFKTAGLDDVGQLCIDGDFPSYADTLLEIPSNDDSLFWDTLVCQIFAHPGFSPEKRARIIDTFFAYAKRKAIALDKLFLTIQAIKSDYLKDSDRPPSLNETIEYINKIV